MRQGSRDLLPRGRQNRMSTKKKNPTNAHFPILNSYPKKTGCASTAAFPRLRIKNWELSVGQILPVFRVSLRGFISFQTPFPEPHPAYPEPSRRDSERAVFHRRG